MTAALALLPRTNSDVIPGPSALVRTPGIQLETGKLTNLQMQFILSIVKGDDVAVNQYLQKNIVDLTLRFTFSVSKGHLNGTKKGVDWTPLHLCCYLGPNAQNLKILFILIRCSNSSPAIINAVNKKGETPLQVFLKHLKKERLLGAYSIQNAVEYDMRRQFFQLLLNNGAQLITLIPLKKTAIHIIAEMGHVRLMELAFRHVSVTPIFREDFLTMLPVGFPTVLMELILDYAFWVNCKEVYDIANSQMIKDRSKTVRTPVSLALEANEGTMVSLLLEPTSEPTSASQVVSYSQASPLTVGGGLSNGIGSAVAGAKASSQNTQYSPMEDGGAVNSQASTDCNSSPEEENVTMGG